jgi:predicted dienelactone hydrolase
LNLQCRHGWKACPFKTSNQESLAAPASANTWSILDHQGNQDSWASYRHISCYLLREVATMRKPIAVLMILASVGMAAQKTPDNYFNTTEVVVWKPTDQAPSAGYPLIVFSHGFGGCNTQSNFLMHALTNAGYVVIAPNHKDSHCAGRHSEEQGWYPGELLNRKNPRKPEEPFQNDKLWTDATYRDRQVDIKKLLDAALAPKSFVGVPVDAQRVGIIGHSLGGYTALGVAGAWPSWKDNRIKAVVAMAPYTSPYVDKGDLEHMNVPVMYQGGTRDLGVTPTVRRMNGAYDRSSTPKYYVEFDGAGHFAWTNLNSGYHDAIDAYTIAFLDRYIKGQTSPDPLARLVATQGIGISYLRVQR